MNPQSLRDPHVDNAIATAAASPDPIVELAREHRAATDRHNADGLSDDDFDGLLLNVIAPLEDKLAHTRPTTREGIIAALDVAAREERKHHGAAPGGTEAMVIGVIENARDALKAGVGAVQEAGPDPLVALWSKWWALEWQRIPEGLTEEEGERFTARKADQAVDVAIEIISASPDTVVGFFAQMAVLKYWADNGIPNSANAALDRFNGRIEKALQDAAGPGGAS